MNLDPRSKLLNTEMGVIVDCPDLAAAIGKTFATAVAPSDAYRLELQSNRVRWIAEVDGRLKTFTDEPDSTWRRRLVLRILRMLPIDGLL